MEPDVSIDTVLNQFVGQALMVAFVMVMRHVLGQGPTKVLVHRAESPGSDTISYEKMDRSERDLRSGLCQVSLHNRTPGQPLLVMRVARSRGSPRNLLTRSDLRHRTSPF